MKENTIYHDDWLNNTLPDKSVQLIIADPPYYKVKGDFDFIWKTFEDYLADVEKWAIECKRVLADNGTLLWYGSSKKIAYSQIIIDKYFKLESNVTLHIFDRQTNKITIEDARSFINTSERLLMYSNEIDRTGLEEIKLSLDNFTPLRNYFELFLLSTGLNKTNVIKLIGQQADHCFRFNSSQWDLPTKETYFKLCELPLKYKFVRKEYEDLRKEYEDLRRPFNPIEQYKMDVLRISQQGHITGQYDHDTIKPEKLTRILITTCSRKNDLVLVPFSGSGTECAMSIKEQRRFIGFDVNENYVKMSNERCTEYLNQKTLF
jgi:site-specific DNA-methyltransferase (adenine-specific)